MDSKLHDNGYSRLFADPELVRQLLLTCVDEAWVRHIRIESLEPLPTKLIDPRLVRRETDILLRAHYRGREAYVLILLELQSSPDRFMALRTLTYTCLAWQSLLERSRKHSQEPALRELPPLFPVVLYTGERAWNEPQRLEALVANAARAADDERKVNAAWPADEGRKAVAELDALRAYVPRFTFHLIDQRRFPLAQLEEARNLISAIFTLEGAGDLTLEDRAARAAQWLRAWRKRNPELVARIVSWVRVRFHPDNRRDGEIRAEDILVPATKRGRKMSTSLETLLEQRDEKVREEVREEARQEKLRTARKALAKGMSPADVAEVTDLPLEEVQKLAH